MKSIKQMKNIKSKYCPSLRTDTAKETYTRKYITHNLLHKTKVNKVKSMQYT